MTRNEAAKYIIENVTEGVMTRIEEVGEVFRNLRDIDVINFIRDNG